MKLVMHISRAPTGALSLFRPHGIDCNVSSANSYYGFDMTSPIVRSHLILSGIAPFAGADLFAAVISSVRKSRPRMERSIRNLKSSLSQAAARLGTLLGILIFPLSPLVSKKAPKRHFQRSSAQDDPLNEYRSASEAHARKFAAAVNHRCA